MAFGSNTSISLLKFDRMSISISTSSKRKAATKSSTWERSLNSGRNIGGSDLDETARPPTGGVRYIVPNYFSTALKT